jgi:subtilisin family serine protease
VDALGAWDVSVGSSAISVAVLDTGVDFLHTDLAAKYASQNDYTGQGLGDGCSGSPEAGHATHVAGIAAADTNNSEGIAGIAWAGKIRSYKVFKLVAGRCATSQEWQATAIIDATNDGAAVINMSFGGWTNH